MSLADKVTAWVDRVREKVENAGIGAADLEELARLARGAPTEGAARRVIRQHLLYLHTATPSIRSQVIAMARHDAVPGSVTQIEPVEQEWPYATVHEAILDGWQVVHFPQQQAPFDDREIDVLGYEFILQKLEEFDA